MSRSESRIRSKCGVAFVGPDPASSGGISMVFRNYMKTEFWRAFYCVIYPMSAEHGSRSSSLLYQVRQLLVFYPWLVRHSPRVVSIHTSGYRGFYRSFVYVLLAKLALRPVVLHVHPGAFAAFYAGSGVIGRWLIRTAVDWSDQVIVLSDEIRAALSSFVPASKVVVMPNPVDFNRFSGLKASKGSGSGRVVLFMGWIIKEKGVYDLVEAIPGVVAQVPDARFVFAGNKEVDRLKEMLKSRGLESVTDVVGWVSGDTKLALFRDSDVLVLPSYTEGLPNVLLEAMASGIPVLTTPVGGIPSLVEDGISGLFVTPGDVAGISRELTRLLADEQLGRRLADAASKRVEAGYGLQSVGRVLEETYLKYLRSDVA